MTWKAIGVLVVFMLFVFSLVLMFDNLPGEPVKLKVNYMEPLVSERVEYGAVPIFAENMRFNHKVISYSIESDCDGEREHDMVRAFSIFSNEVQVVSFYEDVEDVDIRVGCSDEFIELGDDLFAAGEGGPSRIVNTSGFKVIEEGKITLYNTNDCDYPTVALHELCHVFGFDHSDDPKNIMYPTSGCDQRISEDMIEIMQSLYSIEALPDARIEDVSGIARGRYLDFNVSVLNEGLMDIGGINLTILADGERVDVVEMGRIEIGYGRNLRVENLRLPSNNVKKVKFVVDAENDIRELDEGNNIVELIV